MKVLLTGVSGQVGFELQRSLMPLAETVLLDRACLDLADEDAIRSCIQSYQPDIVVNPAAYTAVDKAEAEQELAQKINTRAPQVLAEECARINALLVHYSTDYVFSGDEQGAYVETSQPNPQSVYGKTKHAGELAIAETGVNHLIIRTSWVYGVKGNNFLKTMLRLASEREILNVVADQYGAPTSAALIADVSAHMIAYMMRYRESWSDLQGIYHLTAGGQTSWHEYAHYVISQASELGATLSLSADKVLPIATTEYPTPAKRPVNSVLHTDKIQKQFGVRLPHWQKGVDHVLHELISAQ